MNQNDIKSALAEMQNGNLLEKSKQPLSTLGYRSDLTLELSGTVNDFFEEFPAQTQIQEQNNISVITPNLLRLFFNLLKTKSLMNHN